MRVALPCGVSLEVSGAPPLKRAAVLAAFPLPEPPSVRIRRADGGFDLWPDREDPAYRAALWEAYKAREAALWRFYLLECLPGLEVPAGDAWRADLSALGIKPRAGEAGRRLDFCEFCILQTQADVDALRDAFRRANEGEPADREAAEAWFGLTWNGTPIREAADRLKKGKLAFAPGWAQYQAALAARLLPFHEEEIPPALRARLGLLYYDLPPALRARLEVGYELDVLVRALAADDVRRQYDR